METITTTESRTDAMRRLLEVAKESGVRLGVDHAGDYWATSVSEPGRLYPLTPDSCSCRGFATHRRCRHVAALWAHLGYLDDPEPDPSVCSACAGNGVIEQPCSRWIGGGQTGYRDEWTSPTPCPSCQPVAA